MVSRSRSPRARSQRRWLLPRAVGESLFPASSRASGNLRHSSAHRCSPPISTFTFTQHSPCVYVSGSDFPFLLGFPGGVSGKERTGQCRRRRDVGSVRGSRRSPGGGNGNPVQYSCLANPLDRGIWRATAHGVTKSWHN